MRVVDDERRWDALTQDPTNASYSVESTALRKNGMTCESIGARRIPSRKWYFTGKIGVESISGSKEIAENVLAQNPINAPSLVDFKESKIIGMNNYSFGVRSTFSRVQNGEKIKDGNEMTQNSINGPAENLLATSLRPS